jgi:hypothetical protein
MVSRVGFRGVLCILHRLGGDSLLEGGDIDMIEAGDNRFGCKESVACWGCRLISPE